MKISNAVISWTAQGDTTHPGFAGKMAVHALSDQNTHRFKAGIIDSREPNDAQPHAYGVDERAHSNSPQVRRAYVVEVAKLMVERDGLDPVKVDTFLRDNIDEYRDAFPYSKKVSLT